MTLLHVDTVIAFVAVMLAASLVVTAGTQLIISMLGLRGANLRRSLGDLFESASQDRDAKRYSKVIARRVLHQPLVSGSIFSRFGIRLDGLPFIPADAAGKLRWAGSGIPLQPWIFGAAGGFFGWPILLWVITRLFSSDFCAYSAVVTQYVPFLNLCDHPWRSGAILGAVFGGLVSRWRLATFIRLDEMVAILERLSAPAGGTLPDPAQRAMLVLAGETQSRTVRSKANPVSAQIDRIFRNTVEEDEGGVAVAVERPITQVAAPAEARVEGLNLWFDRAMERASQRFTMQARVITVVLSLVLVLGAHLDAIRLFRMLSSDAQQRAQMAASADALIKQAEQIPRAREGARSVVPDVYRSAMAIVLDLAPATAEQQKPKPRRVSRNSAASADSASAQSGGAPDPSDAQSSANVAQDTGEGAQGEPPSAQTATGAPSKGRGSKKATAKLKPTTKDREKSATAAAPGEDRVTMEAKARAGKALESRPGFASREDAVLWLRATLEGNPALQNLTAAYEQEVNGQLAGDADKLIDHSASIKAELARSEFRVTPEPWPGWEPTSQELPGLLVVLAFLCLGAPICYNMLKSIASLRPHPVVSVSTKDKR